VSLSCIVLCHQLNASEIKQIDKDDNLAYQDGYLNDHETDGYNLAGICVASEGLVRGKK
jgi:hypothetical protein